MTPHTFQRVLLLAEDEHASALDRQVLRRVGVARPIFFTSGRKALDYMLGRGAGQGVDLLVCHERLADMSGLQFLAYVRGMQGIAHIPAVFLTGNRQSLIAQAALACNSCAVLVRPYAESEATAALAAACTPGALHAPLVLPPSFASRFDPQTRVGKRPPLSPLPLTKKSEPRTRGVSAPKQDLTAETAASLLQAGVTALRNEDWGRAESFLQRSYSLDPAHAETCVALSRAAAGQGREEESHVWLCRAGAAYLRANDRTRARDMFIRLPRGKNGQTPILQAAGTAMQRGEVKVAALLFMEAHAQDPSTPLHALVSRVCLFTPAPEEHMRGLVKALADAGHASTAGRLHMRLLSAEEQEETAAAVSFLDRFPVLQDIVSVAGYTFKAWRTAA